MPDDDGRKLLKDLAQKVRDRQKASGLAQLDARGEALLDQIVTDLTGPGGMPGLYAVRDGATRARLQRMGRAGRVTLDWQRSIGMLEVTIEKFGSPARMERYLLRESEGAWRSYSSNGELFADLSAGLAEALYPEAR